MNKVSVKKFKELRSEKGNIIAGILILVAIIGVISVYMMSGDTNASSSASSTSDVAGATLMSDASAIKGTYDTLLVNGNATITFKPGIAATNNMLDPSTGIQNPVPASNAILSGNYWIYSPAATAGIKVNGVGVTATADDVILLTGVKDAVCQQLNNRLHGATTIPASGLAKTVFNTGATQTTPTATSPTDMSGTAGIVGWTAGCVSTLAGPNENVFYRVLKAN